MRREVFNDDGDRDLVFVMGWGNRVEHENVRWLVDRLTGAGYRVTVFQLPTAISDFESEYVAPIAEYVAGLGTYRLLGHSTGALVGEFLDGAEQRAYLSPWWGFNEGLQNPLLAATMHVPVAAPVVPMPVKRDTYGELVTDQQVTDAPNAVAPTFFREARLAQSRLGPFEDGVVFYSPTDEVVSVRTIEERTPPASRVAYEGGHELFDSTGREAYVDLLLAALEEGASALDGGQPPASD